VLRGLYKTTTRRFSQNLNTGKVILRGTKMTTKTHKFFTTFTIILSLLVFAGLAYAGDDDNWRPVTQEELAQKESKVEKDADAEAIFWDTSYDIDILRSVKVKTYVRIKIFTGRGRDQYSTIKILNLPGTKLSDISARVTKPDGSIIELKKNDIFDSTVVKLNKTAIKAKSFIAPNLEVGSILEYRYHEEFPGWNSVTEMMFQQEIPAQSITNCAKVNLHFSKIDMTRDYISNMGKVEFVKKDDFYCVSKQNVLPFHKEPLMPPEERMKPWVKVGTVRTLERKEEEAQDYWAIQAGIIYQLAKQSIKQNEEIKSTATQIIGDAKSDEEKLARLFEFCKTQIKNINYDYQMDDKARTRFYSAQLASETLKNKAGKGWDINYLFVSLAISVGFDARIVRTGDRNYYNYLSQDNKPDNKFPALSNGCIGVIVGNKVYYYDPADYYVPIGMLSWEMEGQKSIVIGPKSFVWYNTAPSNPETSVEKRTGKFKILEDGTLEGEVRLEFTGHIGVDYKKANDRLRQNEREENLKETVKARVSTAEVSNIRVENAQDPIRDFIYTFNVRIPNYAQRTGKRFFIQPNFFEYGSTALFTSFTRIHPIFFEYAWTEDDDIEIEMPQGFELEAESANKIASVSHFVGSDTVQITQSENGKRIMYKRKFKFGTNGKMLYDINSYQTLKTFFENINKNATQLITLRQK